MSRAQFNRDDVLERATGLFWQKGFNGSSMKDVVDATGLQPGSIYLAFGNKEALFRETLENYAQKGVVRIRSILESSENVGLGICQILEEYAKDAGGDNYSSCFLIKTQLEMGAAREDLHDFVSDQLKRIEDIYKTYLAKEFGDELGKRRAASIMLHIFGMRVYGYHQKSYEQIRLALMEGLPWLPWERSHKLLHEI